MIVCFIILIIKHNRKHVTPSCNDYNSFFITVMIIIMIMKIIIMIMKIIIMIMMIIIMIMIIILVIIIPINIT